MLENNDEIILDGDANNVFVGPNGYFKIVIDDFDGETVKAWHLEDADGNRSPNLATRSQGQHIDLVLGTANRTTGSFFSSKYPALYRELLGNSQTWTK